MEAIEEYPYLKHLSRKYIFVSEKEMDFFCSSRSIKLDEKSLSVEVLKKILKDNVYYSYTSNYFCDQINDFVVASLSYGEVTKTIRFTKSDIVKGLEKIVDENIIPLTEIEKERFYKLKNSISFDKFIKENKQKKYQIKIDGKKYSFFAKDLINIMQMNEDNFRKICNAKAINGIKKEYLIFASYMYFKNNLIFSDYNVPSNIKNRYEEIGSNQTIDLFAINNILETEGNLHKKVKINEDLKKCILTGMPKEASDLEKAIYIYIKMCRILIYDDEFYAVNQKGKATKKHKDISYLSQISIENNKVVCFEFNMLFAKFLDDLNIKFYTNYNNLVDEKYGEIHANLKFRCGKFIISADSVNAILQTDMMYAKTNQSLKGLVCSNTNLITKKEFENCVNKMYGLILNQEKENNSIDKLDDLLEEYEKYTTNKRKINIRERLSILIEKVKSKNIVSMDSYSYALQLKKVLFNEYERIHNIHYTLFRSNNPSNGNKYAEINAVFAINEINLFDSPEDNFYYYFNANNELISISLSELQEKFDCGIFEYINSDTPRIPLIKENVGGRKL